jgi:1-phosphofructokinase family hexose kinase
MILCVTLNPCLDKTLTVPPWMMGENVRGIELREVVGGKGNNVARALVRLGRSARPVTFLGGAVGAHCDTLLRRDDGFDPLIVPTRAATRVILTVRTDKTDEQTAFFDPDPSVESSEAANLIEVVERAVSERGVEVLTLSGSSPSPATHEVYSDLVALAKARRVPVFLDTYGAALKAIWGFWPDVIQLNRREAASHLGQPFANDDDVWGLLESWASRGVRLSLVTDGPGPVLAQHRDSRFRARPPQVRPVNPIGSGDCLLAGLVDAWISSSDPELTIRRGLACAVANTLVWDAGAIESAAVREFECTVEIERIDGRR